MNAFLSNTLAELLGRKPQFLVPARPEEFADAFQGKESEESKETVGKRLEKIHAPPTPEEWDQRRDRIVVATLLKVKGRMTMGELAAAMGCSPGEATRRVKLAGDRVKRRKVGRNVFITLR